MTTSISRSNSLFFHLIKEGRVHFFQEKEGSDYIKSNVRKDVGEGGKSDSSWCGERFLKLVPSWRVSA